MALPALAVPTRIESEDREQGNVYNVTAAGNGNYLRVDNGVDPLGWYLNGDTTQASLPVGPGNDLRANEDDWGLFWLNRIEIPQGSGNNVYVGPGAGGGQAILGIFYGAQDQKVSVFTDGDGVQQYTVTVKNLLFKLYEVNIGSNIQTLYNSLGDIGTSGDRNVVGDGYAGWTDLAGAQLVLSGGLIESGDSFKFTSSFDPLVATTGGFGAANLYVSLDSGAGTGIWNPNWDTNTQGSGSDLFMNWTVNNEFENGSLVSSDFGRADVIPEPFTMLALFGGVGLVGGYMRKRQARI